MNSAGPNPAASLHRAAVVFGLTLLISACAPVQTRPAGTWLSERQAWFIARPDWSVEGRLGLSDGERGGSLAMRWSARGDVHRVQLRTIVGGRQWLLRIEPGHAVLSGSEVGRIEGPDPDILVERAVGWPIPVRYMSEWLRGLPAPDLRNFAIGAPGGRHQVRAALRNWRFEASSESNSEPTAETNSL